VVCKFIFRYLCDEPFAHYNLSNKGTITFSDNFGHFPISPKISHIFHISGADVQLVCNFTSGLPFNIIYIINIINI